MAMVLDFIDTEFVHTIPIINDINRDVVDT